MTTSADKEKTTIPKREAVTRALWRMAVCERGAALPSREGRAEGRQAADRATRGERGAMGDAGVRRGMLGVLMPMPYSGARECQRSIAACSARNAVSKSDHRASRLTTTVKQSADPADRTSQSMKSGGRSSSSLPERRRSSSFRAFRDSSRGSEIAPASKAISPSANSPISAESCEESTRKVRPFPAGISGGLLGGVRPECGPVSRHGTGFITEPVGSRVEGLAADASNALDSAACIKRDSALTPVADGGGSYAEEISKSANPAGSFNRSIESVDHAQVSRFVMPMSTQYVLDGNHAL